MYEGFDPHPYSRETIGESRETIGKGFYRLSGKECPCPYSFGHGCSGHPTGNDCSVHPWVLQVL